MEYGATVWDPYQKYNSDRIERVQRRTARFGKSSYSRYSSVSDMLDVLGWTPLSQRRQEARLILFHKIIDGLAQVPFEGLLVEVYKGTRKYPVNTTCNLERLAIQLASCAWKGLAFPEAPSLAVCRSNFL